MPFLKSETYGLIVRYGIVGGVASIFHFTISYNLETKGIFNALIAHFFGYLVGLITAYLGHYYYSFKDKQSHSSRFPKFFLTSLVALISHEAGVLILVNYLKLEYGTFVLPLLLVTVPLITFLLSKFWVFSSPK